MNNGLKVIIVTCEQCRSKQVWNYDTKANECPSCESVVVLKTISDRDLQFVKKRLTSNGNPIIYSDYYIHKISVDDVELAREKRHIAKQAIKESKKALLDLSNKLKKEKLAMLKAGNRLLY